MTTLVLKSNLADKAFAQADLALGTYSLKSGRYWYKGHQNCDLVLLRQGPSLLIYASGGVRFRLAIKSKARGGRQGTLSLLGWLRETPNATRIVLSILSDYAQEVAKKRERKQLLLAQAAAAQIGSPEFTEALGLHFSVKAEEKLESSDRIDDDESDRNFALAVRSHWYHQDFVNFCKQQGLRCHYRPVGDLLRQDADLRLQGSAS